MLAMVLVTMMAVGVVTVVQAALKFKMASENYPRLPPALYSSSVV